MSEYMTAIGSERCRIVPNSAEANNETCRACVVIIGERD